MEKFEINDLVKWTIKRGVWGEGKIEGFEDFGDGMPRARVIATKTINFIGRYGANCLKKGDVGYPINIRKVKKMR